MALELREAQGPAARLLQPHAGHGHDMGRNGPRNPQDRRCRGDLTGGRDGKGMGRGQGQDGDGTGKERSSAAAAAECCCRC